ncbi:TPA: hypothetical protein EYN23_06905 [Candidatus Poribacteria bacterium]|nr:hypothetical protein [Candidatus Poribacteria bacterium]
MGSEDTPNAQDNNSSMPQNIVSNPKFLLGIIAFLSFIIIVGIVYIVQENQLRDRYDITNTVEAKDETQLEEADVTEFVVDSFSPLGQTSKLSVVTVRFSQPIADGLPADNRSGIASLKFSPTIQGQYNWVSNNQLQFLPDNPLAPSTKFIAEILPGVVNSANYVLTGQRSFKFSTERFRVQKSDLNFAYDFGRKEYKVAGRVMFNYPVEVDQLKQHLSLHLAGTKLPYQVKAVGAHSTIEFETEEIRRLGKDQTIMLRVGEGLKPIDAQLGLRRRYSDSVVLRGAGNLVVERASVQSGGSGHYIRLRFSSEIVPEMLQQFFSIEPKIECQIVSDYNSLRIESSDFKPGNNYTVIIRSGLSSIDESLLKRDFTSRLIIPDLEPSLRFVGEGIYLPRGGNLNIGLATINIDKVQIEIEKIFVNNINYLASTQSWSSWTKNLGEKIHNEEINVQKIRNDEVITPILLKDYLDSNRTGIFKIISREVDRGWRRAHQWILITDLGIIAKRANKELLIWVSSLASLEPIPNTKIRLISSNNQTLLSGKTNANGFIKFEAIEKPTEGFQPFMISAEKGEDFSFLQLNKTLISTTDFKVKGPSYLHQGYDAFIYSDRGIYRPGERANLIAVVRDGKNMPPPSIPVVMQVLNPKQQIFGEFRFQTNAQGAVELNLDLPYYVETGGYTSKLLIADQEVGRLVFRVEEFMPDRVKVKIDTSEKAYQLGNEVRVNVEGSNLFGPPAAGMKTTATCDLETDVFVAEKFKSFVFTNSSIEFKKQRLDLGELKLDKNGRASFLLNLPPQMKSPSILKGILSATVSEPGGRAISAYKRIAIHPYLHYIGVRGMTGKGYAKINEETPFEFVSVDQSGEVVPNRDLDVIVYQLYWNSILRRDNQGRYRYISEKQEIEISSHRMKSGVEIRTFTFIPKEWGEYRIEFRDSESGASSSIGFYASGWGYVPWAMDNPSRLDIDLDRPSYLPGDVAKVQIKAPFSGKLFLTIERDRVLSHRTVMMKENTGVIDIPITTDFRPNVYVSVSLVRSAKSLERHAPARAFGIVPIKIDAHKNRLQVELKTPKLIRPNTELEIDYYVTGESGKSHLTVAAVDEGILQLTDFKTPDAHQHFFRQRGLGIQSHDSYSAILPEIKITKGKSSTGGDGVDAGRKRRLSTVSVSRVKPVAMWSGIIETDQFGKGSVKFSVPQFNGSLRIMAVTFSNDRFGFDSEMVTVRDPIVLTPTFPRFVAAGDWFRIPVRVFNGTGQKTDIEVSLVKEGFVEISGSALQTVTLEENQEDQVFFEARAYNAIGIIKFTLLARSSGASAVNFKPTQIVTSLPLRPAAPLVTQSGSGIATDNEPASFIFPSNLLENTANVELILSPFPATKFSAGLSYLLTYPHGCLEQTTSKVFPLLYFKDLAKAVGQKLFINNDADYYVIEGIRKIESMVLYNGLFAYWPGGSHSNHWSSTYAAHFLVEARKVGYQVSDRVYDQMISGLQFQIRQVEQDYRGNDRIAYACYVLALTGYPEKATMNYLKNNQRNSLSDSGWFHLAGAFGASGELNTALNMLPPSISTQTDENRGSGGNFYSRTRTEAIMLGILVDLNENHPMTMQLVERLSDVASKNNRWYTTQENAFAFLALGKMLRKMVNDNYTGKIIVGGKHVADFDANDTYYTDETWLGSEVRIELEGDGNCYYYWTTSGIPTGSVVQEFDKDLMVRRRYLKDNGEPITDNTFKHGSIIVAEVKIKSLNIDLENVAIVDMLPAGFEIENPRIESRAGIPWITDQQFKPDYMDIRDDRLVFYGNFKRGTEIKFYYALRAITQGEFTLPPIAADAMYDPTKSSVASGGQIKVATGEI